MPVQRGSCGNKDQPRTKEQADYNLKYLSAVALLDGQVGPEQLENERVGRDDVPIAELSGLLASVSPSPQRGRSRGRL